MSCKDIDSKKDKIVSAIVFNPSDVVIESGVDESGMLVITKFRVKRKYGKFTRPIIKYFKK